MTPICFKSVSRRGEPDASTRRGRDCGEVRAIVAPWDSEVHLKRYVIRPLVRS